MITTDARRASRIGATLVAVVGVCMGCKEKSAPLPSATTVAVAATASAARVPEPASTRPIPAPLAAHQAKGRVHVDHRNDFYWVYSGTVASKAVVGELLREGDQIWGGYRYVKTGENPELTGYRLALRGTMAGDVLTLTESVAGKNDERKDTGTFSGRQGADGNYAGTWTTVDGARSFPFAWTAGAARGRAGEYATVVANIRSAGSEAPSGDVPVGWAYFMEDVVLIDRRSGFGVHALQRDRPVSVHGDCSPGKALAIDDIDAPPLALSYMKAFPSSKLRSTDVLSDGCERAYETALVAIVVENADHALHALAYTTVTTGAVFDANNVAFDEAL